MELQGSAVSSYENLFKLSAALKLPHRNIEQLFRRMVFNVVFANSDDHLKNHSFIYDDLKDKWNLAPAYDLNYPFDALLNVNKINRALLINGKRHHITLENLLEIGQNYSVSGIRRILESTVAAADDFYFWAERYKFPKIVIDMITSKFNLLEDNDKKIKSQEDETFKHQKINLWNINFKIRMVKNKQGIIERVLDQCRLFSNNKKIFYF